MPILFLTFLSLPAAAQPACDHTAAVQSALMDDAGWSHAGDGHGVTVYRKELADIGLSAFKGEIILPADVDSDAVFETICDIPAHLGISESLDESTLLATADNVQHFYQVMSKAPLLAQRYWMVHSVISRDIDGLSGHHRRTWDALAPALYPDARAVVTERYDGAFEIVENHGSWEVQPLPDGTTRFIYRAVSDPGGNIPAGAYSTLTSRMLPSNMMRFVTAAESAQALPSLP